MSDTSETFPFAAMQDPSTAPRGVSKYEILRYNLAKAIDTGRLQPGARLLAEGDIATQTKFSLGTVQRALRELVADGYIERRHGHGTFVADRGGRLARPLHSRFTEPGSDTILPVYTRVTDRRIETGPGPWRTVLGDDSRGIMRLDRVTDIDGRFSLASHTYLPMRRFDYFMTAPLEKLNGRNLKTALYEEYNLKVTKVTQRMRVAPLSRRIEALIGCRDGRYGMEIAATGYDSAGQAVYLQEIWVPPSEETLLMELVVET